MMVVPFRPDHVMRMDVQVAQTGELTAERMAAQYGHAWTAVVDDRPMCCAGLQEMWPGRAYAWALLARDAGRHMIAITRAVRAHIDRAPFHRIELAVAAEFWPGVRWAKLLGFDLECKARKYMPNGGDAWIFVKV